MTEPKHLTAFTGRRVLIVEDDYFLADETRAKLLKLGALVLGPTCSIIHALEIIESDTVDAAILDVHLKGEIVFPVADTLLTLGIPFVFATSYPPPAIPDRFPGFTLCDRSVALEQIAEALFERRKPLN